MQDKGCGFWDWCNPKMCKRLTHVIPNLLRKMNRMELYERNWKPWQEDGKLKLKNWSLKVQNLRLK